MAGAASLDAVRRGGKVALAQALSDLERAPDARATLSLLDAAYHAPKGHVIGLTGPPGVGKSTLAAALVRHWRSMGESVGVVAVDPSSKIGGGSLLGDRMRMAADPEDQNLFIRSMAAGGQLGGLSESAFPAIILMRALFDRVLVETVGVGQSETDISGVADSVVFCVQPGSGDSLQFMKSGIMEVPDMFVVTKADLGDMAAKAVADLEGALSLRLHPGDWDARVLQVSTLDPRLGIGPLIAALDAHEHWLKTQGLRDLNRRDQMKSWGRTNLLLHIGRDGLAALSEKSLRHLDSETPFQSLYQLRASVQFQSRETPSSPD